MEIEIDKKYFENEGYDFIGSETSELKITNSRKLLLFNFSGKIEIENRNKDFIYIEIFSYGKNEVNLNVKGNVKIMHRHYNNDKSSFSYQLFVESDETQELIFRAVNVSDLQVYANGKITRNVRNASVNVDLKSLNLNGKSVLSPFLEIDSKDVKAKHSALSFFIDKTKLFYFKSRGLNEEDAKRLIAFSLLGIEQ